MLKESIAALVVTDVVLFIFLLLSVRQLLFVVNHNDKSSLCRLLFIAILFSAFIIINSLYYVEPDFEPPTQEVKIIVKLAEWITCLMAYHVLSRFLKQWVEQYVSDPSSKHYRLKILRISQGVFSTFISALYLVYIFGQDLPEIRIITVAILVATAIIVAIAYIIVLRIIQKELNNANITDDNRHDIYSSQQTIRFLMVGIPITAVWLLMGIFVSIQTVYQVWDIPSKLSMLIRPIYVSILFIIGSIAVIFLGFKRLDKENGTSICRNCVRAGLMQDDERIELLNQDTGSASLSQVKGK